ncbi:unnamed protein product, partial [Iphiclides podalirius]
MWTRRAVRRIRALQNSVLVALKLFNSTIGASFKPARSHTRTLVCYRTIGPRGRVGYFALARPNSIDLQFCAAVLCWDCERVNRCIRARECRQRSSHHRRHTTQNDRSTPQEEAV